MNRKDHSSGPREARPRDQARTAYRKIWEAHQVSGDPDSRALIYVDLHLIHEVTSPQAFTRLRAEGRSVRRPDLTLAVMDHTVPTWERSRPTPDPVAAEQLRQLAENCASTGIPLLDLHHRRQGIVHVIGPELGLTQPGMTIVCGDSHTSTHGAFGALAFGIGTSEVEQVLATQCLWQAPAETLEIRVDGELPIGVAAKDMALAIIGRVGVAGAQGTVVEYRGSAIRQLSMEGRLTVCNLTIEAGARAGLVSPDETTVRYLADRPASPRGRDFDRAAEAWLGLATDEEAEFDRTVVIDAAELVPHVTWGTNPAMVAQVTGRVPRLSDFATDSERQQVARALEYMGLTEGAAIEEILIDRVFIGSCTNSRLEDLRAAAAIAAGGRVHPRVRAMVVPGSQSVKRAAEAEGLDRIFTDAGFEWREAGCSMCLGMNPDVLAPGERCASTSNRNFEGRQGAGGRTHLVSPAMAAAAALHGHFVDVRTLQPAALAAVR
ncbi:MAG TPA: 3-isopropylmalate dehydratase large subunit [Candidatus Dormibacteraeota bacterium]|nr:3-isopropylmalate dehydratase large subunit [Candidatus Dormibacteraeota bacterium]